MRYMVDINTIPKGKPSPEEIARNEWQYEEKRLLGLLPSPYDGESNIDGVDLVEFTSRLDYLTAAFRAYEFLERYEPVPKSIRTRLIKEAENFRQHGIEPSIF